MEEKFISITYKNDEQSFYEAHYKQAKLKGRLSKKQNIKMFLICFAVLSLFGGSLILSDYIAKKDISADITLCALMILSSVVLFALNRVFYTSQLKNVTRTMYQYGFDSKSPKKAVFGETGLVLESGYSHAEVPYEEFDYMISDRLNFIFGFGSDMKVRNIPKINQNPDELFALDNLLREKLGDRFICEMEGLS